VNQILKTRLKEYDNKPKQAFSTPFYKLDKDGNPASIVKFVKIESTQKSGIAVRGGVADNSSMIRVDVFSRKGKNYLVPVYVNQIARKIMPNKAIKQAHNAKSEWMEMTADYDFQFSLYPADLIKVETKEDTLFGY
jgi:CRISPR-associated endonuclease Csn1